MGFFSSKDGRTLGYRSCETPSQATSPRSTSPCRPRRRQRPGKPEKKVRVRKTFNSPGPAGPLRGQPPASAVGCVMAPAMPALPGLSCRPDSPVSGDCPQSWPPLRSGGSSATGPSGPTTRQLPVLGRESPLVATHQSPELFQVPASLVSGLDTSSLPSCQPEPVQPLPAEQLQPSRVLAQHEIHGVLPRAANQVPVRYEVGDLVLEKQAGRPLDPLAPVFLPLADRGSLEEDLAACPEILDEFLGDSRGDSSLLLPAQPPPRPCSCHQLARGSCPLFIDRFVQTVTQVLQHGKPNMDGARIVLEDTQIDPTPWERILGSYFDKRELVNSLLFGWDFSLLDNPAPKDAQANLPSAVEFPEHVQAYLDTELQFGAIVGPLPADLPFKTFKNPLGTVPKPHCPDSRRVITDCSQRGWGINSWIPHDSHRGKQVIITLPGTAQIVAAIKRTRYRYPGEIIKLWKSDYSRFYRQFLSCPSQSPFLCIGWKGETYADRSWSFGNRGACQSSQRFSSAVAWVFRTQVEPYPGVKNSGLGCRCSHACGCGDNEAMPYIDDTIGVCAASNAEWLFRSFIELVTGLTLKLSRTPGHISPPATSCVALGILYDTQTNLVSLPLDKLVLLRQMLAEWKNKKTATPKELASLAGRLLWCSAVVPPGRVFLGRVLALKRAADARDENQARRPVGLDRDFKLDLAWWADWTDTWNGKSFLEPRHAADLALDASSNGWSGNKPGIGAYSYFNNEYIATGVPDDLLDWPISDLELVAYLLAIRAWKHLWSGMEISFLTDNEATRHLLQHGRTRIPRRLAIARAVVAEQVQGNFRISSDRISTTDNVMADSLSRLAQPGKLDEFNRACVNSNVVPVRVPVQPEWFEF